MIASSKYDNNFIFLLAIVKLFTRSTSLITEADDVKDFIADNGGDNRVISMSLAIYNGTMYGLLIMKSTP